MSWAEREESSPEHLQHRRFGLLTQSLYPPDQDECAPGIASLGSLPLPDSRDRWFGLQLEQGSLNAWVVGN